MLFMLVFLLLLLLFVVKFVIVVGIVVVMECRFLDMCCGDWNVVWFVFCCMVVGWHWCLCGVLSVFVVHSLEHVGQKMRLKYLKSGRSSERSLSRLGGLLLGKCAIMCFFTRPGVASIVSD